MNGMKTGAGRSLQEGTLFDSEELGKLEVKDDSLTSKDN